MMRILRWILPLGVSVLLGGCGYSALQSLDEQATNAWADVLIQYQRRADVALNLVNAVQAQAPNESPVAQRVSDARTRVGTVQLTPDLLQTPDGLNDFQAAQAEMSAALSQLLLVARSYPRLQADPAFRDLLAQYDGNENRIAVARNRYIRAVQDYNMAVREFPGNLTAMVLGYTPKPNFALDNEKGPSTPPSVALEGASPVSPPSVPPGVR